MKVCFGGKEYLFPEKTNDNSGINLEDHLEFIQQSLKPNTGDWNQPRTFAWAMQQAIEGKRVRRPTFLIGQDSIGLHDGVMSQWHQKQPIVNHCRRFTTDDLTATDWEIVPE